MTVIHIKDVQIKPVYHPLYIVISKEPDYVLSPKVGEYLDFRDIETMLCNGCKIILEPRDTRYRPFNS
jgi:hypothetical protein